MGRAMRQKKHAVYWAQRITGNPDIIPVTQEVT